MTNFGIIVKIQGKNVIVVSEAGLFEMIKYREGMFVGQKIFYSGKDIISKKQKQKYKYFIPAIASIAAIFILLMSYFKFFYTDKIYAYIDVDINPSIELMVNEDSIVIDAVAFNEDGEVVLSGIKHKGGLLEKVVYDVIKSSEKHGFIKREEKEIVLISTAFENIKQPVEKELFNHKLINNLKNEMDEELDDSIDIQFVEVSIDKRHLASEAEVSMGKYLIYEKAKEKGKDIPIDVLKKSNLNQLIKENDIDILQLALENNEDIEKTTKIPTATPIITHMQEEEVPAKTPDIEATPTKTPVKTPKEEVTPTKTPVKTPKAEATPTKTPVKTPKAEATPTKTPIKTPEAEATPTKTPVKTPEAEATPTKTPVKTPKAEATPTKTPVKTPKEETPTKTPEKTPEAEVTPTKTPAKTPEAEVTPTKTPVKTPEAETTPTKAPEGEKSIKIQVYNDNAVSKTDSIYLNIRVYNTGDEEIDLSDIKIRYYYTRDGSAQQKFICDWSTVGTSNVKAKFIEMSSSVDNADTILEMSFSDGAGVLKPKSFVRLKIRVFKEDWSHYVQSNDYSFNSSANNFVDWKKVTGYISGSLKWGEEP